MRALLAAHPSIFVLILIFRRESRGSIGNRKGSGDSKRGGDWWNNMLDEEERKASAGSARERRRSGSDSPSERDRGRKKSRSRSPSPPRQRRSRSDSRGEKRDRVAIQ